MGLYAELQNILEVAFFYPFLIPCLCGIHFIICQYAKAWRGAED